MDTAKVDSKISWIIAVACACMNSFILTPFKVSGLIFVEIIDRYHVGRNVAAYPAFIMTLLRCSGGPFAGYFAERFGVNEVMILGSVLSAVGISACFFAEDVAAVIVFFGIIHGFGITLTNTFLPIIIKLHFKKHVTMAFGVTQAGVSIWAFFTTPLFLWIFQSYGTSGGFLIIGAVVINSLPIALFLYVSSPNRSHTMKSKEGTEEHLETVAATTVSFSVDKDNNKACNVDGKFETRELNSVSVENDNPACDHTEDKRSKIDDEELSDLDKQNVSTTSLDEIGNSKSMEAERNRVGYHKIILKTQPKNIVQEKETNLSANRKMNVLENHFKGSNPVAEIPGKSNTNTFEIGRDSYVNSNSENKIISEKNQKDVLKCQAITIQECIPCKNSNSDATPESVESFASTSCYEVKPVNNQGRLTAKSGKVLIPSIDNLNERSTKSTLESRKQSNSEISEKEEQKRHKKPTVELEYTIRLGKKYLMIFFDVTYWVLMASVALQIFILILFYITMIDFSRDKSIDTSNEVYLLMIIPIGELVGRVGLGWITDGNYLTPINFCIMSHIGMGCSCLLMALAQGFYVAIASVFFFSIVTSAQTVMIAIVIFEFFDSDKHAMGQASKHFLFGPLTFLNGPLIGYCRDTLGSYIWLYCSMAVMSVACTVLTASIPAIARRRNKKENRS